jgi:hypothetical protein
LQARASHAAFHPGAPQRILNLDPALFALLRHLPGWLQGDNRAVLSIINVSDEQRAVSVALDEGAPAQWVDMLDAVAYTLEDGALRLVLAPYQVLWLAAAVGDTHAAQAETV